MNRGKPAPEAAIRDAIWNAFDGQDNRDQIMGALLSLLPEPHAARVRAGRGDGDFHIWRIPDGQFGPDLAVVDDHEEVLLVIELKTRAAENLPLAQTVHSRITAARASGALQQTERGAKVAATLGIHDIAGHIPHTADGSCNCWWHRPNRRKNATGWVRTLSQFDAYLTYGWVHPNMRRTTTEDAVFLFIDEVGVPVAAPGRYAEFGAEWTSCTFADLRSALTATTPAAPKVDILLTLLNTLTRVPGPKQ